MSDAAPEAAAPAAEPAPVAGFVYESGRRRFLAALIDNLTWLIAISWLLSYLPQSTYDDHPEVAGLVFLALLSAWFNYFAFSEWKWGQTIGKNALGMRVISIDRTKPSFGQASIRNLLRLIDFFVIGWVLIAADERKQRLGDKAAHTVVVRNPRSYPRHYGSTPVPPSRPTPAKPPSPAGLPGASWDLSATIWGLIGGVVIGGLFAPLLVLPFDPGLDSDGSILAAQGLFSATLATFAVGVASGWRLDSVRGGLRALGMRRAGWSAFGIALLTLFGYYIALALFANLVVQPDQEDIANDLGVDDPSVVIAVSAVLLIALVSPVVEELFFRGMVFGGLRTRLSLWPAAVISGIVFGLPHVPTGPIAAIPLAGLGFALAWLYERTGSLWPCILVHVINNSIAVAAAS